MHTAYFGGEGSYTHLVTQRAFPGESLQGYAFVPDICAALHEGRAHRGVIPLENKVNGAVMPSLDALLDERGTIGIVQELVLPIHHCVGGRVTGTVQEVRSHQQALEQCLLWIRATYGSVQLTATSSTATAAAQIGAHALDTTVAIAAEETLRSNGLEIYHRDILPHNKTRFGVIAPLTRTSFPMHFAPTMRTALGIYLSEDAPGALHSLTAPLAERGINMYQIHSRPDRKGGYHFFLEVAGTPLSGPLNKGALCDVFTNLTRNLALKGSSIAVLGIYQSNGWDV